jgi:glycosyltransferase involved in cell wall biosynthesis
MKPPSLLIIYPVSRAFITPFKNMCSVFKEFSGAERVLISSTDDTGAEIPCEIVNHHHIRITNDHTIFSRIINYILTEFRISSLLFKYANPDDTIIFFMQNVLLLPMISSKILRIHIVWLLPSSVKISEWDSRTDPLSAFPVLFQKIGYFIADTIVVYSPSLIRDWHLEKYKNKIKIAHEHFLDFNEFRVTKQFSDRPYKIGYIGRMNYEKGFGNFASALPVLLESDKNITILIGGDGPLKGAVDSILGQGVYATRTDFPGWILHENLPFHLNELRLLVIPSFMEGLPNIMLEAMACGTPVLATPVGTIPDIITDGETGFIMENNSPQCITDNIIRALNDHDLEKIALNAKKMVEKDFTFESTVRQWKKLIDET